MSQRSVEILVSLLFLVVGVLGMYDSWSHGAGWESDGPQSGYFPFYIALLMSGASIVNLVQAVVGGARDEFVDRESLMRVLTVLVPSAIFVAVIPWIGIYVAGAIFIAAFMWWVGKYAIWKGAAVGAGVMIALFFVFQKWFLIQLPTGPVEQFFGLA
ncbi:MAG: tripartite tricarboxylate transporter TctB family protein [Hyphomicrobiales bacterium]